MCVAPQPKCLSHDFGGHGALLRTQVPRRSHALALDSPECGASGFGFGNGSAPSSALGDAHSGFDGDNRSAPRSSSTRTRATESFPLGAPFPSPPPPPFAPAQAQYSAPSPITTPNRSSSSFSLSPNAVPPTSYRLSFAPSTAPSASPDFSYPITSASSGACLQGPQSRSSLLGPNSSSFATDWFADSMHSGFNREPAAGSRDFHFDDCDAEVHAISSDCSAGEMEHEGAPQKVVQQQERTESKSRRREAEGSAKKEKAKAKKTSFSSHTGLKKLASRKSTPQMEKEKNEAQPMADKKHSMMRDLDSNSLFCLPR